MEEWITYKLKDICSKITDGSHFSPTACDCGFPMLSVKDMEEYGFNYNSCKRISKEDFDTLKANDCVPLKGDILVAKDGSFLKQIFICNETREEAILSSIAMFRPNPAYIISEFLCYILKSPKVYNYIAQNCVSGSALPRIVLKAFKEVEISIPSIDIQKWIINKLKPIDEKIALNRRINDNLEQQAQALFKSWFVDFEPFKGGEFVDSELGSNPKELPIVYIEDIPHNIESGKRPKGGATLEGIPSIGAENIKGLGYYDYSKTKYIPEEYARTIRKGKINGYELLIYKDGGKPGYFIPNFTIFGEGFPFSEMYINEHVFILDLMDNGYNAFAYFYMRTPYIMNQLNSIGGKAAIPGINTKDVECLPIYAKESPYVKMFGEIVLPYIKTILSNSLENAKLAKVRDSLLPKLMSGELTVNEI